jgi:hypothetical protein
LLVKEKDIRFEEMQCGQSILAGIKNSDGEVEYEPALVIDVITEGTSIRYDVSLDSGEIAT